MPNSIFELLQLPAIIAFFFPVPETIGEKCTLFFNICIVGLFALAAVTFIVSILRYYLFEKPAIKALTTNALQAYESDSFNQKTLVRKIPFFTICRRYIGEIFDVVQKKGIIQQEEIKNKINERISGNPIYVFAETTTRILLIVGLLGTLIGLGLIVYEVGDILKSYNFSGLESIDTLVSNLEDAIYGMQTAIATSIMGLICSFPLVFMNSYFRSSVSQSLSETTAVISAYILPRLMVVDERALDLSGLIRNQKLIADRIEQGFRNVRQTTRELGAIQDRFHEIIKNIESISKNSDVNQIYENLQQNFNQLMSPMNTLCTSTERVVQALHSHNLKVEEIVERLAETTAANIRRHLASEKEKTISDLKEAVVQFTVQSEQNIEAISNRVLEKFAERQFGSSGYIFHFPSSQSFVWFVMGIVLVTSAFIIPPLYVAGLALCMITGLGIYRIFFKS